MHVVSCNASWCKNFCLLEADSRKHKTSAAQQTQTELLSLTALGKALDNEAWGESFTQARGEYGFTENQYFLTSYSESKAKWTDHRMTTAEATSWLRDILCGQVGRGRADKLTRDFMGCKVIDLFSGRASGIGTPCIQRPQGFNDLQ